MPDKISDSKVDVEQITCKNHQILKLTRSKLILEDSIFKDLFTGFNSNKTSSFLMKDSELEDYYRKIPFKCSLGLTSEGFLTDFCSQ